MQRRDVINQRQPQLLKYVYASHANELALMTNVLGNVSTLSNKALFSNKCFSYTNVLGLISYLSTLIILELQKLKWAPNNIRNLLWNF